jgi:uncharacterized protein (DUF2345 family)
VARFSGSAGGEGTPGPEGPAGANGTNGADGADGADALWNFTGEYSGGAAYAVGDIATYDGQLWYRANSNGGNVGDTPSEGFIWDLLAAKGQDGAGGSGGLVFLGNYVPGNGYIANVAIVRGSDNNLYIATSSGGLADPVGNIMEWQIFSNNAGGSADIADFVFTNVDSTNSSITVTGDKELTIQSGSSEDLNVRAGDDLWLTADDNIFVQADDEVNLRSQGSTTIVTNYSDLGDAEYEWQFGSQGYLTLPGGGEIINSPDSSGDGSGYSTLKLDPDNTLETDQYIMIDPTGPNHIHVRAGGTPDDSSADLFLGAELNNVQVSDQGREVTIRARGVDTTYTALNANMENNGSFVLSMNTEIVEGDSVIVNDISYLIDNIVFDSPIAGLQTFTASGATFTGSQTYTFNRPATNSSSWEFRSDGTLVGPEMGLTVLGLLNSDNDDLGLYANDADIILQAASGKVDIIAPEVNIVSNVVPSSLNINTYLGAVINSNRTSGYDPEDKVVATLGDIQGASTGDITFDGVKITGAGTASGDGLGAGTMELVPDADLYANDQYLVIDPTDPNHIHIRAGGAMDESNAKVILGGERNHVYVSDGSRQVSIRTRPARIENTYANVNEASSTEFMAPMPIIVSVGYTVTVEDTDYDVTAVTPNSPYEGLATVTATGASFVSGTSYTFSYEESYDNYWQFNSDGTLYGPVMGGLKVPGLLNSGSYDLELQADDADINLQASSGAVNIAATEVNINSNSVPSSLNINTYEGAIVNSARTASYANEDKVVATLGDIDAARFGASASYHSRVDQGPQASANLVQPFTFSTTDWETGILRVDNTKIKMLSAGKYNIAFSAQLYQSSNTGTINIWLNKNGSPMAYTNTKVVVESNAPYKVAAWNFFVDAAVDDYYEIIWSSSSTNTKIEYDAAQTINGNVHPEIPSIIVTVNQVG